MSPSASSAGPSGSSSPPSQHGTKPGVLTTNTLTRTAYPKQSLAQNVLPTHTRAQNTRPKQEATQNVPPASIRTQNTRPKHAPMSTRALPPGFVREEVPIVTGLEENYQFGETDEGGSKLSEIADQLPATTFWPFAKEFFTKLPELIFRETTLERVSMPFKRTGRPSGDRSDVGDKQS